MGQHFDIQNLVDDLSPVRAANPARSVTFPIAAMIAVLCSIAAIYGVRQDVLNGAPDVMFLLRSGTLLLLGLASAWAVIRMASPSVGRHENGWKIALAAALLFPLAGILVSIKQDPVPAMQAMQSGFQCLRLSVISGLFIALPMIFTLRRGAPTSPFLAGWVTGIAAGGLGAFVYNFHCPFNNIIYIGFWYSMAVGICAIAGRLVIPPLIRW
jgi:hypothetical protein